MIPAWSSALDAAPPPRSAAWLLLPSGAAALMLQVVWVRLLGLSLGSTSGAVATVLAAFFGGLALGSLLAGRLSRGGRSPWRVFATLEAVVGLSALVLLPVLLGLESVVARLPIDPSSLLSSFGVSLALLLAPTTCMGATWPVLAQALVRPDHRQRDLARLYALNTAGAMLGALGAAWLVVPLVGLDGAARVAAALELLVAVIAWRLAAGADRDPCAAPTPAPARAPAPDDVDAGDPRTALTVLAVGGGVTLLSEVAWTRALGLLTGTTMTGFATLVAAVLLGLALGSRLASHLGRLTRRHLVAGLLLLGASLLLTRALLSLLPQLIAATGGDGPLADLRRVAVTMALLAPPTVVLGALYPLALARLGGAPARLAARVGGAVALNTVAGIAGSLAAGFWALPRFGTDATLLAAAWIPLGAALVLGLATPGAARVVLPALALALVAVSPALPGPVTQRLLLAAQARWDEPDTAAPDDVTWFHVVEGKEGVVATLSRDGRTVILQNDGLRESRVDLRDPLSGLWAETLLGLVPWLLHPGPHSAFVVGFGGGTTTRALTASDLGTLTVVELDRAVVDAMAALPGRPLVELDDPRVTLRIADARHVLTVEPTRYDLVVSQPSHPWVAGAGHLFTREFFALASSRLTDDGVFGQWINLFRMDATTLRSVLAAFFDVFEHGFALVDTTQGDLLVFGSRAPLRLDAPWVADRMLRPAARSWFRRQHLPRPIDLLGPFAFSRREALDACRGSAPNTDLSILTEVRLSSTIEVGGAEDPHVFLDGLRGFDLLGLLDPSTGPGTLRQLGEILVLRRRPDLGARVAETLRPAHPGLAAEIDALVAAPPR